LPELPLFFRTPGCNGVSHCVISGGAVFSCISKSVRCSQQHDIRHIRKAYLDPVENLPASIGESFGIKPPDKTRTPAPTPSTLPVVTLKLFSPGVIGFYFRGVNKKWGKDPDAHGIELCWTTRRQVSMNSFIPHLRLPHRCLLPLTSPNAEKSSTTPPAGKTVPQKGPWTEIASVVIS